MSTLEKRVTLVTTTRKIQAERKTVKVKKVKKTVKAPLHDDVKLDLQLRSWAMILMVFLFAPTVPSCISHTKHLNIAYI